MGDIGSERKLGFGLPAGLIGAAVSPLHNEVPFWTNKEKYPLWVWRKRSATRCSVSQACASDKRDDRLSENRKDQAQFLRKSPGMREMRASL